MDLDTVIHTPSRLQIVTYLDATLFDPADEVTFGEAQKDLGMTAGNLTTHLTKLADAGYVEILKTFAGRKPVTYIRFTERGRSAYRDYRQMLLSLLGGTE